MTVKRLNEHTLEFLSFKGGCTGWSESTLVKLPYCWKSHAMADISIFQTAIPIITVTALLHDWLIKVFKTYCL